MPLPVDPTQGKKGARIPVDPFAPPVQLRTPVDPFASAGLSRKPVDPFEPAQPTLPGIQPEAFSGNKPKRREIERAITHPQPIQQPTTPPPAAVPTAPRPPFEDPAKEQAFQQWYKNTAVPIGLNPNPDDPAHQYDYRRAFEAGAAPDPAQGMHWPSEFKLAGHPNRFVDGVDTVTGQPAPTPGKEDELPLPILRAASAGTAIVQGVGRALSGLGEKTFQTQEPADTEPTLRELTPNERAARVARGLTERFNQFLSSPAFEEPRQRFTQEIARRAIPTGKLSDFWYNGLQSADLDMRTADAGNRFWTGNIDGNEMRQILRDLKQEDSIVEATTKKLDPGKTWIQRAVRGAIQSAGPMAESAAGAEILPPILYWQQQGSGMMIRDVLREVDPNKLTDAQLKALVNRTQVAGLLYGATEMIQNFIPGLRGMGLDPAGWLAKQATRKLLARPIISRLTHVAVRNAAQIPFETLEEGVQQVIQDYAHDAGIPEGKQRTFQELWDNGVEHMKQALGPVAIISLVGAAPANIDTLQRGTPEAQQIEFENKRANMIGRLIEQGVPAIEANRLANATSKSEFDQILSRIQEKSPTPIDFGTEAGRQQVADIQRETIGSEFLNLADTARMAGNEEEAAIYEGYVERIAKAADPMAEAEAIRAEDEKRQYGTPLPKTTAAAADPAAAQAIIDQMVQEGSTDALNPPKTPVDSRASSQDTLRSQAKEWDFKNRHSRGDAWFEGAKLNQDAVRGFEEALQAGGDTLAAHGMAKEGNLGHAIDTLLGLLNNGLDMTRRGGKLDAAALVSGDANASGGATASGGAFTDGPFILVARRGQGLSGKLDGLGAILVNEAHANIVPALRQVVQSIRPDIIVESYANAGAVARTLTQNETTFTATPTTKANSYTPEPPKTPVAAPEAGEVSAPEQALIGALAGKPEAVPMLESTDAALRLGSSLSTEEGAQTVADMLAYSRRLDAAVEAFQAAITPETPKAVQQTGINAAAQAQFLHEALEAAGVPRETILPTPPTQPSQVSQPATAPTTVSPPRAGIESGQSLQPAKVHQEAMTTPPKIEKDSQAHDRIEKAREEAGLRVEVVPDAKWDELEAIAVKYGKLPADWQVNLHNGVIRRREHARFKGDPDHAVAHEMGHVVDKKNGVMEKLGAAGDEQVARDLVGVLGGHAAGDVDVSNWIKDLRGGDRNGMAGEAVAEAMAQRMLNPSEFAKRYPALDKAFGLALSESKKGAANETPEEVQTPTEVKKPWEIAAENVKPYVERLRTLSDKELRAEDKRVSDLINGMANKGTLGGQEYFDLSAQLAAIVDEQDSRKGGKKPDITKPKAVRAAAIQAAKAKKEAQRKKVEDALQVTPTVEVGKQPKRPEGTGPGEGERVQPSQQGPQTSEARKEEGIGGVSVKPTFSEWTYAKKFNAKRQERINHVQTAYVRAFGQDSLDALSEGLKAAGPTFQGQNEIDDFLRVANAILGGELQAPTTADEAEELSTKFLEEDHAKTVEKMVQLIEGMKPGAEQYLTDEEKLAVDDTLEESDDRDQYTVEKRTDKEAGAGGFNWVIRRKSDAEINAEAVPAEKPAPAAKPETKPVPVQGNQFKKGDRVIINSDISGDTKGRHGTIDEVSVIVMRTISFGGPRSEERTAYYTVKTDEGYVTSSLRAEDLVPEGDQKPSNVILDPVYQGTAITPQHLFRSIKSDRDRAQRARNSAERRQKTIYRDKDLQEAKRYDEAAQAQQAILDAWIQKNPEQAAALEITPQAEAKKAAEAPKPSGVTVRENERHNGVEVKFAGRPEDSVISALRAKGFRWSGRQKLWYAPRTPERLAWAKSLVGEKAPPVAPQPQPQGEEIRAGQDIKDLDAQVRKITPPSKTNPEWTVEVGLQESLGEAGGDIWTENYSAKPDLQTLRRDILAEYRRTKSVINEQIAKSGREELVESAIDKVLKAQGIQPKAEKPSMLNKPPPGGWTEADKVPVDQTRPFQYGQRDFKKGLPRVPPEGLNAEAAKKWLAGWDAANLAAPVPEKPAIKSPTANLNDADQARLKELQAKLRKKLTTEMRVGPDPEIITLGAEMAGLYIKGGVKTFGQFAARVKSDMGDLWDSIKRYLHGIWTTAAADNPEIEEASRADASAVINALDKEAESGHVKAGGGDEQGSEQTGVGEREGRSEAGNVEALGEESQPEGSRRSGRMGGEQPDTGEAVGSEGNAVEEGDRGTGPGVGSDRQGEGERGDTSRGSRNLRDVRGPDSPAVANYAPSEEDRRYIEKRGDKRRFQDAISALQLVHDLDSQQRKPTAAEQATLFRYPGWGGLKAAFSDTNKAWAREYSQLRQLVSDGIITEDQYKAMRASIQDAHYTSPTVIERGLHAAMSRFGFNGGRMVEAGSGIGLIHLMIPSAWKGSSSYVGIERDPITAKIAQYLLPESDVHATEFQKAVLSRGSYDASIGNPPFGSNSLYFSHNKPINKFSIHNQFIAEQIELLRPGGIGAFVVSRYFLDAKDPTARNYIAGKARFLGAIRLPNTAFKGNAATEVTTDLVFFQRLPEGEKPVKGLMGTLDALAKSGDWLNVGEFSDAGGTVNVNQWMLDHPEMMLGIPSTQGKLQAGEVEFTLNPKQDQDLGSDLDNAVSKLPADLYTQADPETMRRLSTPIDVSSELPEGVKVGTYFVGGQSGRIYRRTPDVDMKPQATVVEFKNATAEERVVGILKIRDALNRLVAAEMNDTMTDKGLATLRRDLNQWYDAFVKKYGYLNNSANRQAYRDSDDIWRVFALERDYDPGIGAGAKAVLEGRETARKPSANKAAIFSQRVNAPYREITKVSSSKEALSVSLNQRGLVDLKYMGKLSGKSEAELTADLHGEIYLTPDGWQQKARAGSGNVREKAQEAEAIAHIGPAEREYAEFVKSQIPKDVSYADIAVAIGAPWIDAKDYAAFSVELTGEEPTTVHFNKANGGWYFRHDDMGPRSTTTWGTPRVPFGDLMYLMMNRKPVVVYDTHKDAQGVEHRELNREQTELAQAKASEIRLRFDDWLWKDKARQARLARVYNDSYNNYVEPQYDGSHLELPGTSAEIVLRPHQKNVIWRTITDLRVLYDHVVGAGKTFAGIASFMELKRIGRVRKPLFVVPNHLVRQWRDEFIKLYPNANILATEPSDFKKENRQKLFGKILTGEFDAVIVGHSSFKKIGLSTETQAEFLHEQLAIIEAAVREAEDIAKAEGKRKRSRTQAQYEKMRDAIKAKLDALADTTGEKDTVATFEELGVDGLFVDEYHELGKNLFYTTQMQGVAGLGDPKGSGKAFDLYMKTQYLAKHFGGKAPIVFATGTPISNSMVEMFTLQRYLQSEELDKMGLKTLDAWAAVFGKVEPVYEVDPSGTRFRLSTRFREFGNVGDLAMLYRTVADVVTNEDLQQQSASRGERFPIPKVVGGKPQTIGVKRSEEQAEYFEAPALDDNGQPQRDAQGMIIHAPYTILGRIENLRNVDPTVDNMLKITNDARKSGLDQRLINPSAKDRPDSKVNKAVSEITRIYKKWNKDKGTQLVFCDLSVPGSARDKILQTVFYRDSGGEIVEGKGRGVKMENAPEWAEVYAIERKGESAAASGWIVVERHTGYQFSADHKRGAAIAEAQEKSTEELWDSLENRHARTGDLTLEEIEAWQEQQAKAEPEDADSVTLDELLAAESAFSVYDDVRAKLMANGIPQAQIAFIHDYDTPAKKQKLFDAMNRGDVRVLIGSTPKMGAGMNVQRRLVALHHLDAPWRPSDLEQREGRIIRQGNMFYEASMQDYANPQDYDTDPNAFAVEVLRYGTELTYDTRMWQIIEHKAIGIVGFRKAERSTRSMDDIGGEAANAADMKAAISGDPRIQKEIELRNERGKLEALRRAWMRNQSEVENHLDWLKGADSRLAETEKLYKERIRIRDENTAHDEKGKPVFRFEAAHSRTDENKPLPNVSDKKEGLSKHILTAAQSAMLSGTRNSSIGKYRGFHIEAYVNEYAQGGPQIEILAAGDLTERGSYVTQYGRNDKIDDVGFVQRLDNFLAGFELAIDMANKKRNEQKAEAAELAGQVGIPFKQQAQLEQVQRDHEAVKRELMSKSSAQFSIVPIGVKGAITPEQAKAKVDPIVKRLNLKPEDVVVVPNFDALPGDLGPRFREMVTKQDFTEQDIGGAHWRGKVYVFTDNLRSIDDVDGVLFEELAHRGFDFLKGPDLEWLYNHIYQNNLWEKRRDHARAAAAVRERYNIDESTPEGRWHVTNEILGHIAQNRAAKPSLWKRLVQGLRSLLQRIFRGTAIERALRQEPNLIEDLIDVALRAQAGTVQEGQAALNVQKGKRAVTPEMFYALAEQQRGKPESAMTAAQHAMGGGVFQPTLMNANDILHRMSEENTFRWAGYDAVISKVESLDDALNHPYGFEREMRENFDGNARYYKVPVEAFTKKVDEALSRFIAEYEKLPTYNTAQRTAKSLALAMGRKDFDTARSLVAELKSHLKTEKDWIKYAHEGLSTTESDNIQFSLVPKGTKVTKKEQEIIDWVREQKARFAKGKDIFQAGAEGVVATKQPETFKARIEAMRLKAKDREKAAAARKTAQGLSRGEKRGRRAGLEEAKARLRHIRLLVSGMMPTQSEAAKRDVLRAVLGNRFANLLNANKNNLDLAFEKAEANIDKQLSMLYRVKIRKLVRKHPAKEMLPAYRDQMNAEWQIYKDNPGILKGLSGDAAKDLYEGLSKIVSDNYGAMELQTERGVVSHQIAANEIVKEVEANGKPLLPMKAGRVDIEAASEEVGQPIKNRGGVVDLLHDKVATPKTRAAAVGNGAEGRTEYWFYHHLRYGENKRYNSLWRARDAFRASMNKNGVSDLDMLNMMTVRAPVKVGGRTISMSQGEMMEFMANYLDPETREHILENGWTLYRLKGSHAVIRSGDPAEMNLLALGIMDKLPTNLQNLVQDAVKIVTDMGIEGNKASVAIDGFERFNPDKPHWSRMVDITETPREVGEGWRPFMDRVLENLGFLKERVKHKNPVVIGDFFTHFEQQADQMSRYAHLALPIRNVLMLMGDPDVAQALNQYQGTDFTAFMKDTLEELAGFRITKRIEFLRSLVEKVGGNVAAAKLGFQPTTYFYNRGLGSIAALSVLMHVDPKVGRSFAMRAFKPVSLHTASSKKAIELLMSRGFFRNRWDSDVTRWFIPHTYTEAELPTSKINFVMQWLKRKGLSPMAGAEMRNAVAIIRAARANGYSDEKALDLAEETTRDSQNASSPLDESPWYRSIRASGFGFIFPFTSQNNAIGNLFLRDADDLKRSLRTGKGLGKAVKNLMITVGMIAVTTLLQNWLRKEMAEAKKWGLSMFWKEPPESELAKERLNYWFGVLSDTMANFLPGSSQFSDTIRYVTAKAINAMGGDIDVMPGQGGTTDIISDSLEKIVRGADLLGEPKDAYKTTEALFALIEGTGALLGLPMGGPMTYARIVRGGVAPKEVKEPKNTFRARYEELRKQQKERIQ